MQTFAPSMFARNDTLLGVCQSIGEDLGFNPTWLRVGFACGIFFNLFATVAVYLGLGLFVAATRWAYPAPRQLIERDEATEAGRAPAQAHNDEDQPALPIAA